MPFLQFAFSPTLTMEGTQDRKASVWEWGRDTSSVYVNTKGLGGWVGEPCSQATQALQSLKSNRYNFPTLFHSSSPPLSSDLSTLVESRAVHLLGRKPRLRGEKLKYGRLD